MFIAILKFRRDSYDYYGDSTRLDTVTLEAETHDELNRLVEKATNDNVYQRRGDFNLLMSESSLISINTYKTEDE